MDEPGLLALMKRFRIAYARADRDELLAVTTSDFTWHQHTGAGRGDLPTGRVLKGIDALLKEVQWRSEHWTDVRYEGLEERVAGGDLLVQTFTISGQEEGVPFTANAVDLYPIVDGKIARKDTYWKHSR